MRLIVRTSDARSFEAFCEDETAWQRTLAAFGAPGVRLVGFDLDPVTEGAPEPRQVWVNSAQVVTIEPQP